MSNRLRSIRRRQEWTPKRPRSQQPILENVDFAELETRMLAMAKRMEQDPLVQARSILRSLGSVALGTGRSPTEPAVYYPTPEGGWKRIPSD